ncbi:MAG: hypothetical protein QG602_2464 [Verrucomicrobiota bacterium]|nr:hypothetical protein [Verrucomicrobiota bacterium]
MSITIVDRNGWKYARVPQPGRCGGSMLRALRTRSDDEARELVKSAKLEEIALASRADALTRDVWTRLLAGRNLRVRDAIESYESHRHVVGQAPETVRHDGEIIDRFVHHAGLNLSPLAALEARHVAAFVNQTGPQKISTRELWLAVLNGWLSYLADQRWIVRNPALDVAVRLEGLTQQQLVTTPRAPFTDAEVRALLAVVPRSDFWHGAILFGYHYGLRLGAVATIEEGNIVANRLRLYTRKGRRIVDEPLADEIWAWLQEWRTARPSSDLPHLFPVQAAIQESGSSLLSVQFGRLLARHGIENRSFHGLRKTAAQNRWADELKQLGDKGQRAVIALVSRHGMQKVQEMLAHAPGSDVTEKHYLPRT